jgi:hypothetical protein
MYKIEGCHPEISKLYPTQRKMIGGGHCDNNPKVNKEIEDE